jgi:hypothetical protein
VGVKCGGGFHGAEFAGAGCGIGKVGADLDAKCVLLARTDC